MSKKIKSAISKRGYVFLIIALLLITVGYVIMSTGDRTISIIFLIIAYVLIIPISLLLPDKKKEDGNDKP